jgi:hypothetical protein
MSATAHKYRRFCLVDPRAACEAGTDVVLEGGPCDGLAVRMPLRSHGAMTVCTWPDGLDGSQDHFYPRTKYRDRDGRIICRYVGAAVRA